MLRSAPRMTRRPHNEQQGIALILALIFSILLYILVAELVVSARLLRVTGENDALLARMANQADNTFSEIEDTLLSDLAGAAAGEEGGALGGVGAPPMGAGAEGTEGGEAGEGGEQEDPSATCDSSRDGWAKPQSRAENDLTTYYWVEAENAKFNLLSLWSPDPKWAEFSRDQLVRLLDNLREDTESDIGASDADRIVRAIEEWARRSGSDRLPRPPLKSDDQRAQELTLPLHLDELLMLPDITEGLFYDQVLDGRVLRGLESVLTIWTSLQFDPGDPDKNARRAAMGSSGAGGGNAGAGNAGAGSAGGNAAGGSGGGSGGGAPAGQPGGGFAPPTDPNASPQQPMGEGIRININFAPRSVLRAIMPEAAIPDSVIDAILRYRNEVDPEAQDAAETGSTTSDPYAFGGLELGEEQKLKYFATVDDLDQVEEFANLPDPQVKTDFKSFCTTKSDVFSIHLATMFRRNEENRVYVMRRARSIVMRVDDGAEGKLYPVVRYEERHGMRVQASDLQDDPNNRVQDMSMQYVGMDQFAQEDRAWNPFLVDFYLPKWQRDQLMNRR